MTQAAATLHHDLPESLADFETRVLGFLSQHASLRQERVLHWGEGNDRVFIFPERDPAEEEADLARARAWRERAFESGFGWITGPEEYGGSGLSDLHLRRYRELEARFDVPPGAWFTISCDIIAPTILAFGSSLVKDLYLRRIHRGEVLACQLLSEPEAGSDLAGVMARAERDGDDWIISGQKVWTSGAQHADLGEVIVRTDPSATKHRGLSAFLVDMHAPGISVRPLRQMSGGASFNEVFLDRVRVPDTHRLGEAGDGWQVVLKTLMSERAAFAEGSSGMEVDLERLIQLYRHFVNDDGQLRLALADVWIRNRIGQMTNQRLAENVAPGEAPGPIMSIGKLMAVDNLVRASALVSRILGPTLTADAGSWGTYAWAEFVLSVPGTRIASGSDEIQRNVLAERVLGLPRDAAGPAFAGRSVRGRAQ